jgi:plasmid stabilization system protein ParE
VKLFIQSAAENDILIQFEWYATKGLFDIARRFRAAVNEAVNAAIATPAAGAPRHIDNLRLTGLRTWPVNGFDDFKVYYLASSEFLTVVRILHGRRDIEAILGTQDVEQPDQR